MVGVADPSELPATSTHQPDGPDGVATLTDAADASDGTLPATTAGRYTHHPRPPRWLAPVLIAVVVGLNILGWIVTAAWPRLLRDHPLLLICLSNRYRYLLLTRTRIGPVPQVVVGVLRNLASDPIYWAAGWFYGDKVLGLFRQSVGKGDVIIAKTEDWFQRFGDLIVFITPSPFVCALAGATRIRPRRFWAVNIAGTISMMVGLRLIGSAIESPINAFLRFNERYNKILIAISIAAVVFVIFNAGFGGKTQKVRDIDNEAQRG